jgi:hypothetical protein
MLRVVLSATDFRDLVHGKIVEKVGVGGGNVYQEIEICLSDIGFYAMRDILEEAIYDRWGYSLDNYKSPLPGDPQS